ncbi:unnamed protein product [Ectocarpus fasciculatus]
MPPGRHGDGLGDAAGGVASGVVDVSRLQQFDDAFLNKNRPPPPLLRREARAAVIAAVHGGDNNSFGRQQQQQQQQHHQPVSSRLSWAKVHWAPRKRTSRLITTAAGGMAQQQTTQLSSWAKVHWTPRRRPSQQQHQRLSPTSSSSSPPGRTTSRLTTAATFDGSDAGGGGGRVARRPRLNSWAKVHWQPQRHTSWSGRPEQRPPVVATATHRVARTARLTTWAKCQWSPDQSSRSAAVSPGSSRRHASSSSTTLRGAAAATAAAAGGGTLARFAVTPPPQAPPPRAQAVVSTPSLGGDRRIFYDPPGGGRRPLNTARPAVAAATVGSTGPKDLSGAPVEVIGTAERYFEVLRENAQKDQIVVIKIYAGFCRACKAFDRKFRLLSLDFQEQGANVKFFEMDWMQTRDLCKSLQKKVKKLPHMELYVGERGRLESFVCGPSKSSLLKEKLDKLVADPADPSLGEAPIPDEEAIAAAIAAEAAEM